MTLWNAPCAEAHTLNLDDLSLEKMERIGSDKNAVDVLTGDASKE